MKQFKHIVKAAEGIHARPAMMLMQFTKNLSSRVTVEYQGKSANAKNIMQLFALRANQGAEVTFFVEGGNEASDVEKLEEFCRNNL